MNKCFMILFLLVMVNTVDAKKLYKWVDKDGQVHYSDQVPADQIKKKHEELNEQGIVLEKVGNARTKEEIQAEREAKLRKIAADKQAAKEEKQRQNIIKAYTNEQEIIRLKEERISALERNIELANQSLNFQKTSKEQLLSMAADNERNGIEVSKALKSRIKIIEEKIDYQNKFIQIKKNEIDKVKAKFARDLEIYRDAISQAKPH
jgi:succinylglutamate desuccinylase